MVWCGVVPRCGVVWCGAEVWRHLHRVEAHQVPGHPALQAGQGRPVPYRLTGSIRYFKTKTKTKSKTNP